MKSIFTLIALFITCTTFSQALQTSDFEQKDLAVYSVKDYGNKLVINDSISLKKGDSIRIGLPFNGKDFQFVEKKKSGFAKIVKKAAGALSSGAMAVGLISNDLSALNGAIKVARSAHAIYYGADALEKINELPISRKAKKIAGKKMEILKWEKKDMMHVITAKFKRKKYHITLEAAYVTHEILLN